MTVSVEQAQSSLKELIQRTSQGETIVITQGQTPVAELRAVSGLKPTPVFGSCKGMLTVNCEDDEHLKDFAEYME